ncbi:MAG TPA: LytTR family DNA-binding domain-containing protein [Bacteroidia bacterium]|jgi:two-component system LytT family response regulator|nr:LytTR family DNA-binding domain-containing protein [Bacteroidia bacterium]
MIRTVIIDDIADAQEELLTLLDKHCKNVSVVATAHNVKLGIEAIKLHRPNLVILDIQMPDGTGFDLLKEITKIDFKIIFSSGYQEHAIQAFKFSAIDYLIKPVNTDELIAAIKRVEEIDMVENIETKINTFHNNLLNKTKESKKLIINENAQIIVVSLTDIIRCEAEVNYTRFYLTDGRKLLSTKNLKEYEEFLSEFNFFRPHQTHLINIDYLESFKKNDPSCVIMKDKTVIPVAARKKSDLKEYLHKL